MLILPHAAVLVMRLVRAVDNASRDVSPAFSRADEVPGLGHVDAAAHEDIEGGEAEGAGFTVSGRGEWVFGGRAGRRGAGTRW